MNKKEALTQLEIMATNATGRLGSAKSEEERALLNKQIEALNMAIDALKDYKPKTGRWIPYDRYDELAPERLRKYKCSVCGEKQRSVLTGGRLIGGYGAEAIGSTYKNDFEKFFSPYCPFCGAKMGGNEDERNE